MYRLALLLILCCMFVVDGASGGRDIRLLSGDPNKVDISDTFGTIHITDGDPNTFVFECFDDVTGEPADIAFIGLSGTPSGTIKVAILPGPGHTYGAANVYVVHLTGTNVTGVLAELKIEEDLATTGDVQCDRLAMEGDVICEDVIHNITVNEQLSPGSDMYGLIASGDIGGNIYVGRFFGDILVENGTIGGNITLGDVGLYTSGRIVTAGSYDHTLAITISGTLVSGRVAHPSRSEGWGRDSLG